VQEALFLTLTLIHTDLMVTMLLQFVVMIGGGTDNYLDVRHHGDDSHAVAGEEEEDDEHEEHVPEELACATTQIRKNCGHAITLIFQNPHVME